MCAVYLQADLAFKVNTPQSPDARVNFLYDVNEYFQEIPQSQSPSLLSDNGAMQHENNTDPSSRDGISGNHSQNDMTIRSYRDDSSDTSIYHKISSNNTKYHTPGSSATIDCSGNVTAGNHSTSESPNLADLGSPNRVNNSFTDGEFSNAFHSPIKEPTLHGEITMNEESCADNDIFADVDDATIASLVYQAECANLPGSLQPMAPTTAINSCDSAFNQPLERCKASKDVTGTLAGKEEPARWTPVSNVPSRPSPPLRRPSFPQRVCQKSPIQGLSNQILLRTCFSIYEAYSAGITSPHMGIRDNPSMSSRILFELYTSVERSYRSGDYQYFYFTDTSIQNMCFLGVWNSWAGNPVFEKSGKEFLGIGGREWVYRSNAVKKKKHDEVEKRLCRAVGTISRNGSLGLNGFHSPDLQISPSSTESAIMAIQNIQKVEWSDIEYAKAIIEL